METVVERNKKCGAGRWLQLLLGFKMFQVCFGFPLQLGKMISSWSCSCCCWFVVVVFVFMGIDCNHNQSFKLASSKYGLNQAIAQIGSHFSVRIYQVHPSPFTNCPVPLDAFARFAVLLQYPGFPMKIFGERVQATAKNINKNMVTWPWLIQTLQKDIYIWIYTLIYHISQ